jgi:hypothetical protein
MGKARVEQHHYRNQTAHASRVSASPRSKRVRKAKRDPRADRLLSGKTVLGTIEALGRLRQRAGIAGVGTLVGFGTCVYAIHAGLPLTRVVLMLIGVMCFSVVMIFWQWLERWTIGLRCRSINLRELISGSSSAPPNATPRHTGILAQPAAAERCHAVGRRPEHRCITAEYRKDNRN